MSIIQAIMASISASSGNGGGGGGGGGGDGATYQSWTIEWWGKKLSPQSGTHPRVFSMGYDATAYIGYSNESGGDYIWTNGTNAMGTAMTVGTIVNTWVHWAMVSDGTNLTFYKNGTQLAQAARTGGPIVNTNTAFQLATDNTSFWKGKIADFHIVKGAAKYTTNFAPPSSRIQTSASTVLLMPFNSSSGWAAATGPNPVSESGLLSTDDPYGQTDASAGSAQFDGSVTNVTWDANVIFALDVA